MIARLVSGNKRTRDRARSLASRCRFARTLFREHYQLVGSFIQRVTINLWRDVSTCARDLHMYLCKYVQVLLYVYILFFIRVEPPADVTPSSKDIVTPVIATTAPRVSSFIYSENKYKILQGLRALSRAPSPSLCRRLSKSPLLLLVRRRLFSWTRLASSASSGLQSPA